MKDKPGIVFLGTPEFAVDSLDILIRHGYDILAVVTSPDQPAGRGQTIQSSPVKKFAQNHHIRVLQPARLKDPEFLNELYSLQADLFIVVAFRMLPEQVWAMPPLGTFNLHASLLPQYRGAAPINHVIINGETETGLTTFFLKHDIDTGDIIFQEKMMIGPDETAGELHDRMKTAGASLVLKTVRAIASGNVDPVNQNSLPDQVKPLLPAPKISRDFCCIDWKADLDNLYNKVRGLSPYPAAFTYLTTSDGSSHLVKVYRTFKMPGNHMLPLQSIVTDGRTELGIAVTGGIIYITEIQQAGKKVMNIGEFLKGFRLKSDQKVG